MQCDTHTQSEEWRTHLRDGNRLYSSSFERLPEDWVRLHWLQESIPPIWRGGLDVIVWITFANDGHGGTLSCGRYDKTTVSWASDCLFFGQSSVLASSEDMSDMLERDEHSTQFRHVEHIFRTLVTHPVDAVTSFRIPFFPSNRPCRLVQAMDLLRGNVWRAQFAAQSHQP